MKISLQTVFMESLIQTLFPFLKVNFSQLDQTMALCIRIHTAKRRQRALQDSRGELLTKNLEYLKLTLPISSSLIHLLNTRTVLFQSKLILILKIVSLLLQRMGISFSKLQANSKKETLAMKLLGLQKRCTFKFPLAKLSGSLLLRQLSAL